MTEWFDKQLAQLDKVRDYDQLRELTKYMSDWAEALATSVWQLTEKPDNTQLRTQCKRMLKSYVTNEDVSTIDARLVEPEPTAEPAPFIQSLASDAAMRPMEAPKGPPLPLPLHDEVAHEVVVHSPCWICEQAAIGVRASAIGAISGAYCLECLSTGREPWAVLVGGLVGCERGQVGNWVVPIMEATLSFYGKTEDEFWDEVEKTGAGYKAHLAAKDTPSEARNEWRCGRCGHEMPDSYDAGCDKCGAGNDALVLMEGSED